MSDPVDALIDDMLAWILLRPRLHAEVMEAWRTSCPRLPVWEDATDLGLVALRRDGGGLMVEVTAAGRARLSRRPVSRSGASSPAPARP